MFRNSVKRNTETEQQEKVQ